ncbi:RHS repeat-associated core domain-containing protein [Paractinoplanes toevensis]|nr:RHS repeat-associated core domain-containing protein [Actinoplanes toevensis]
MLVAEGLDTPASAADPRPVRPAGAADAAPVQRTGAAPSGSHYLPAGSSDTSLPAKGGKGVRPAGAVPDRLTAPVLAEPAPAPRRIKPVVKPAGARRAGFDARTSKLVAEPDARTELYQNADGTMTALLASSSGAITTDGDTFVMSGHGDESGSTDLQVGTDDGGKHIGRAYLKFGDLATTLKNKYVNGAALTVFESWADSCSATPVTVFQVSESWSASSLRWPGASVNRAYETRSFAHQGGASGSCAPAWESLALNADDATGWTHGRAFYGLSLRAPNEKSNAQFKRFAAAESANPPRLSVTYSAEGAAYGVDSVLLPTNTTAGNAVVKVTNQGSSTWAAGGGFKAGVVVKNGSTVVATGAKVAPSAAVAPLGTGTITVPIPAVAPGTYTVELQMYDASGASFNSAYGVPIGTFPIKVNNVLPAANFEQPGSGAEVESITPTLYAEGVDPDNWPANAKLKYDFKICSGTPEAPTNCTSSGFTGHTWTTPALKWSSTYYWWIRVHDTIGAGPYSGPLMLTTRVPQPEITSNLGGSPDTVQAPGVDPGVGNYSTVVTDASVTTVGPDLTITRTYNSLDPRRTNAFGSGWASRVDTALAEDKVAGASTAPSAVITLPTGRQVRFGRNPDGSYAPPQGDAITLVRNDTTATWTLRDASGSRWVFDALGRLVTLIDADGLTETLRYDTGDHVVEILNNVSNRKLNLTWTGAHVTEVRANGGPAWTYTYTGNRLTSVCGPDPAPNCTTYEYGDTSHYRSAVLNDAPRGYWRFGETSGSTAANTTARSPGDDAGTYTGVVLNADGAVAGAGEHAAVFDGASSRVTLPSKVTTSSMSAAAELWFKTTESGTLLSYQNGQSFPGTATAWTPVMYVGVDGLLYAGFSVPKPEGPRQAVSDAVVNDGNWHHAAISAAVNRQTLYIDGVAQKIAAVGPVDHDDQIQYTVGAGQGKDWPSTNGAGFYFDGAIDELALYTQPLSALAVANHYAAAAKIDVLTGVVLPQDGRRFAALTYDDAADRVRTLKDSWGRDWRLDAPFRNGGTATIALHGPYPDWTYTIDYDHGARLVSVTHNGTGQYYEYNAAGFVSKITDPNNHSAVFTTDSRGNVLSEQSCRQPGACDTSYTSYYLNSADPLDPRNDKVTAELDARSSGPADTTYQTTYGYDPTGRLVTASYPKPTGVSARPDESWDYATGSEAAEGGGTVPAGVLVKHTGVRDQVTSYTYRSTGDLARETSPLGLNTRYAYDEQGRVSTRTTGNDGGATFGTTTYTYTPSSLVKTETGPAVKNPITGVTHQQVTTYGYDGNGNTVSVTDADATGGDPARTTLYGFDAHDRPASTRFADGTANSTTYSADGLTVTTADAGGITWTSVYDDQRQLLTRTANGPGADPQNPTANSALTLEWRGYDPGGRLTSYSDAIGRITNYTYYDNDLLATSVRKGYHAPDGTVRDVTLEKRSYDAAGNLTQLVEGGVTTTNAYDPAAAVSRTVVDPGGAARTTDYLYDPESNVVQETRTGAAQPGRSEVTTYGYGPDNQLTRTDQQPAGGTVLSTVTTYDERGLPRSVRNPRVLTTDYTYDANGRPSTETGPAVDTWVAGKQTKSVRPAVTTGYNTFGEATVRKDANGAVTTTAYDLMGRAAGITQPTYSPPGGVAITPTVSYEYDYQGNVTKFTDGLQRVTSSTYDPYGNQTSITLPPVGSRPSTTAFRYNRNGEEVSATTPGGSQTLATYDELGNQVTETRVERQPAPTSYLITATEYDDAGHATKVTTPQGHATNLAYDTSGLLSKVTDATGRETSYAYDLAGRQLSSTDPSGLTTATVYDLAGRTVGGEQRRGTTVLRGTTAELDPNGNTRTATTGGGRKMTYDYDAYDRVVAQTSPAEAGHDVQVQTGYDAAGNTTRYVDGNNHATDYTYNVWGLLESTIEPATAAAPDPAQRTWTFAYDKAGQAVTQRLPGGVVRTATYDAQGRLTGESGTGAEVPTADRTLGYDADGRTVKVSDISYSYDDRGDLIGSSGPAGTTSQSFSGDGHLMTRTDAAGTASFTYDDAGRPLTFSDPVTGRTVDYGYDTAGRLGSVIDRAASKTVKRVLTYDDLERLAADRVEQTVTAGLPPRVLLGDAYIYDGDDKVTGKTQYTASGSTANSYTYDGLGRLSTWTSPSGTVDYDFDDAGNRIRAGSVTSTYNEQNQLTSDGTNTYTYSSRGTLDRSTKGEVSYDAFERLIADGSTSYTYDSLDRLSTRNGIGGFAYDGLTNDVAADGSRVVSRDSWGQPFADKAVSGGTARMLYADEHGDVTGRYLSASAPDTRSYDPFGEVTASAGETAATGYQGSWTDTATGSVNMASRWYDPGTGSFQSRDTWAVDPEPAGSGNRYAYGTGDPVANADPSGHCPICEGIILWAEYEWHHPTRLGYEQCEMEGPGACHKNSWATYRGPSGMRPDRSRYSHYTNPHPTKKGPGNGPGNGPGGGGGPRGGGGPSGSEPRYTPPPPPPPPPWEPPLFKPVKPPAPGTQVKPRVPRINIKLPKFKIVDPGPAITAGIAALVTTAVGTIEETGAGLTLLVGGLLVDWLNQVGKRPKNNPRLRTWESDDDPLSQQTKEQRDECFADGSLNGEEIHYKDVEPSYDPDEPRGRATGAEACYNPPGPKSVGTVATYTPPGYQSTPNNEMARGHLIGRELGGNGQIPENIVPLWQRKVNSGAMYHGVEKIVNEWSKTNQVYYSVTPVYGNPKSDVPTSIEFVVATPGQPVFRATIRNIK